jgi:hypothetical protein
MWKLCIQSECLASCCLPSSHTTTVKPSILQKRDCPWGHACDVMECVSHWASWPSAASRSSEAQGDETCASQLWWQSISTVLLLRSVITHKNLLNIHASEYMYKLCTVCIDCTSLSECWQLDSFSHYKGTHRETPSWLVNSQQVLSKKHFKKGI